MTAKQDELYNEACRIVGTAVLRNDRNYADDLVSLINSEVLAVLEELESKRVSIPTKVKVKTKVGQEGGRVAFDSVKGFIPLSELATIKERYM